MTASPTQRSLAECRRRGWPAGVVERWIGPHGAGGKRVDLFGFIDLIALDDYAGCLAIQATSSGVADRLRKIDTECHDLAWEWLRAGNRIEVWGWTKRGKAGRRKLWRLRRVLVERGGDEHGARGLVFIQLRADGSEQKYIYLPPKETRS